MSIDDLAEGDGALERRDDARLFKECACIGAVAGGVLALAAVSGLVYVLSTESMSSGLNFQTASLAILSAAGSVILGGAAGLWVGYSLDTISRYVRAVPSLFRRTSHSSYAVLPPSYSGIEAVVIYNPARVPGRRARRAAKQGAALLGNRLAAYEVQQIPQRTRNPAPGHYVIQSALSPEMYPAGGVQALPGKVRVYVSGLRTREQRLIAATAVEETAAYMGNLLAHRTHRMDSLP